MQQRLVDMDARTTTSVSPIRFLSGDAFLLPAQDLLPFQLCKSSKDADEETAGRGGCINLFFQADQCDMLLFELIKNVQEIPGASGKPGNGFNNDRVTFADKIKHFLQLGSVPVFSGNLFCKNFFDMVFLHHYVLPQSGLDGRADALIGNFHLGSFRFNKTRRILERSNIRQVKFLDRCLQAFQKVWFVRL